MKTSKVDLSSPEIQPEIEGRFGWKPHSFRFREIEEMLLQLQLCLVKLMYHSLSPTKRRPFAKKRLPTSISWQPKRGSGRCWAKSHEFMPKLRIASKQARQRHPGVSVSWIFDVLVLFCVRVCVFVDPQLVEQNMRQWRWIRSQGSQGCNEDEGRSNGN